MWPRRLDASTRATDAQRQASAAYIKSQTHEGWALIATRFDDGGFSGANLERPALRTLLEAIEQRRIDVVVYKVDRLTHRWPISLFIGTACIGRSLLRKISIWRQY